MKVGDLIRLHDSTRKNGALAGKVGLVVDLDSFHNPTVSIAGQIRSFHYTQIKEIIYPVGVNK